MQRFRQRRLFLLCESLFVAGCIVPALAGGAGTGRVLSGFATGLPRPDLKAWIEGRRPAIELPELLARVRN